MIESKIYDLRTKDQTLEFIKQIKDQRTEKRKSELRTKFGVSIVDNPLLDLPVDLNM